MNDIDDEVDTKLLSLVVIVKPLPNNPVPSPEVIIS